MKIAVTFCTPEFEQYAEVWESMIRELGGEPVVIRMPSTGDYNRNTGLKPTALLKAWDLVTETWFFYLDIDTRITAFPYPPDGLWDVGIVENRVKEHKNRCSAATLFFRKDKPARAFLLEWEKGCKFSKNKDHPILTRTIAMERSRRLVKIKDVTGSVEWIPNGLREAASAPESTEPAPVILFKYPSRGRPKNFFRSLDSLVRNLKDLKNYHVACSLDEDDKRMNNAEVRRQLAGYRNLSVQWGKSTSKIHAINRDMPDVPWDIIVCMSDDMVFNRHGFDNLIRAELQTFPDGDGLLHFPDQNAGERLATMFIAGRKYYDRFGYIYHPGFKSLWCDNLVQDIAQKLNRYKFVNYAINVHLNPAYGHAPKDEMFVRQQKDWDHDEALYLEIKGRGYDL